MASWKYPSKIVLGFFNNCQEKIKIETKSLRILWEGVYFSKAWSLQPVTLVLAYSFIESGLLTDVVQVFFVPFRNTHSAKHHFVAAPCEILYNVKMSRKPSNKEAVARKCSVKKMFLKASKNSQENACARVSFW